ncbi:hypothetical protein EVAR_38000_1 [Eumeta japonica]|uniref:Uncharacterized protein n=1 Tax=Eumeta variegata TaxID=151549 RepID=A0A4C1WW51_EUMVA|nr:hypothetical protein EVAR_38000_1 [Eumeta japonica]
MVSPPKSERETDIKVKARVPSTRAQLARLRAERDRDANVLQVIQMSKRAIRRCDMQDKRVYEPPEKEITDAYRHSQHQKLH